MTRFVTPNPDFAARVRDSFARQAFMTTLGAAVVDVRPGHCEIALDYRPALSQQHGYFHGGVIGCLADNAGGYASFTLAPADASILTVEYKLNIVAPGDGERLIARGQVVKPGRTLVIARTEVSVVKVGQENCAPWR